MAGRRFGNVFVLCTGRCGSMTFSKAASHITNFTVSHEGRTAATGPARLAYPPAHIEVDNRLAWILGRLDAVWGPRPLYVHLSRSAEATAQSFAQRADRGILLAYRTDILMNAGRLNPGATPLDFARDYVETVTANIRLFLRDKPHVEHVTLEDGARGFARVWDRIGAEGDLQAALAEWSVRHNATLPGLSPASAPPSGHG